MLFLKKFIFKSIMMDIEIYKCYTYYLSRHNL